MSQNRPSISVIIPARNEYENLKKLFHSLSKLTYPRQKIEYILIDDNSTDQTRSLAQDFGARIIKVKTGDIELNKGIGLKQARGELVYWMDADMEVCSKRFFELLTDPLIVDKSLIGSFTNEFALNCQPPIKNSLLRFISYDELQRDPLYKFFSNSIQNTIIKKYRNYSVCKFIPGKIPPCGRTLYRRKKILETNIGKGKSFIDLETLEIVTRAGFDHFAYVPKAKIRHFHASTLKQLIQKRLRNLERDYLPLYEKKYYKWFDLKKRSDRFKIFFWVIYANLFLPELIHGIFQSLIHRDLAFLWQPIVALTTTDSIIWGFISKPKGRKLMLQIFR